MPWGKNKNEWPPERNERFRALWADPSLSCAEIGRRMGGLSASAIAGKRRRLGLPARGSPLRVAGSGVRPYRRLGGVQIGPDPLPNLCATLPELPSVPCGAPQDAPQAASQAGPPLQPQPPPQPLQQPLPRGTCQFISGDVRFPGWCFCGDRVAKIGSPWCVKHRRVVYQPRSTMRAEVGGW